MDVEFKVFKLHTCLCVLDKDNPDENSKYNQSF